jgi:hypothetical protein
MLDRSTSVTVWHHHVQQDQVGPGRRGHLQGLRAAGRRHYVEAGEPQGPGQQLQDGRLVVDDQQPRLSPD